MPGVMTWEEMGVAAFLRSKRVRLRGSLLKVPVPEGLPSFRLHVDSQVEDLLPSLARPAHAAAFESMADQGLGSRLHGTTGEDQARSVIAGVVHFIPVGAEVAQFGGRLAMALGSF